MSLFTFFKHIISVTIRDGHWVIPQSTRSGFNRIFTQSPVLNHFCPVGGKRYFKWHIYTLNWICTPVFTFSWFFQWEIRLFAETTSPMKPWNLQRARKTALFKKKQTIYTVFRSGEMVSFLTSYYLCRAVKLLWKTLSREVLSHSLPISAAKRSSKHYCIPVLKSKVVGEVTVKLYLSTLGSRVTDDVEMSLRSLQTLYGTTIVMGQRVAQHQVRNLFVQSLNIVK